MWEGVICQSEWQGGAELGCAVGPPVVQQQGTQYGACAGRAQRLQQGPQLPCITAWLGSQRLQLCSAVCASAHTPAPQRGTDWLAKPPPAAARGAWLICGTLQREAACDLAARPKPCVRATCGGAAARSNGAPVVDCRLRFKKNAVLPHQCPGRCGRSTARPGFGPRHSGRHPAGTCMAQHEGDGGLWDPARHGRGPPGSGQQRRRHAGLEAALLGDERAEGRPLPASARAPHRT